MRPSGERLRIADIDAEGRRTFYDMASQTPVPEGEMLWDLAPASAYYSEAQARDFVTLLRRDGVSVPKAFTAVLADRPRGEVRKAVGRELHEVQRRIAAGDESDALFAKFAYLRDAQARKANPPPTLDPHKWRAAQEAELASRGNPTWSVPVCLAALRRYEAECGPVATPDRGEWVAANWRRLRPLTRRGERRP